MHLITHILGRQVVLKDTSVSTLERSHINVIFAISNLHTKMFLCILGGYRRVKYFINVICVINSLLLQVILAGIGGSTSQINHIIVILAKTVWEEQFSCQSQEDTHWREAFSTKISLVVQHHNMRRLYMFFSIKVYSPIILLYIL